MPSLVPEGCPGPCRAVQGVGGLPLEWDEAGVSWVLGPAGLRKPALC